MKKRRLWWECYSVDKCSLHNYSCSYTTRHSHRKWFRRKTNLRRQDHSLTILKYFEIHYIDEWYEWNVPGWAKNFSTDSRKMSYWIAWNLWKYLFHYSYQYLSHHLIQVHYFQKFISISFILDLVPDSTRASVEFNGEYISFAQASFKSLSVP